MTLLLTSISVYVQKRRISILKLHGYTFKAIFWYLIKDSLLYIFLGIILSLIPCLLIYQGGLYLRGLKVIPLFLIVAGTILGINLVIILLSTIFTRYFKLESIVKRNNKNDFIVIGALFSKVLIVIMLSLTIIDTIKIVGDYETYNEKLVFYLENYSDEYQLDLKNFKSYRQLYEAMNKSITEVMKNEHTLFADIQDIYNKNVVYTNIGYINSLNLIGDKNQNIQIDNSNWATTALTTKDNYEWLKSTLSVSPNLCFSDSTDCSYLNIMVVQKQMIYPLFENYIQGEQPFDSFIILPATQVFSHLDTIYRANNPESLEKEIFPILDDHIDTKLLKFTSRLEFFQEKNTELKTSLLDKLFNLLLSITIFIGIYIFLLLSSFSNLSKRVGVNKILGNPTLRLYI